MRSTAVLAEQPAILFEDERVVVVDKPAGMLTQPSAEEANALLGWASAERGVALSVVHRLDRPVSGVVAFAKHRPAAAWLSEQLRAGAAKIYLALVRTGMAPEKTVIVEPIDKVRPGKMKTAATGKPARTSVVPIAFDADRDEALVAVQLHTGRTHQARVHLAAEIGAVLGDIKYGDITGGARIGLHAVALSVPETRQFAAIALCQPPPPSFWALCRSERLRDAAWQQTVDQLRSA